MREIFPVDTPRADATTRVDLQRRRFLPGSTSGLHRGICETATRQTKVLGGRDHYGMLAQASSSGSTDAKKSKSKVDF